MLLRLTPNRRMAQFLGEGTLSLEEWLHSLYPLALTPDEACILWEKIILDSEWGETILRASPTARQAFSAWGLNLDWQLDLFNLDTHFITDETNAYRQWAKSYQMQCQEAGWMDSHVRIDNLMIAFKKGEWIPPEEIELVGFDEFTPQLTLLLDCLKEAGTTVQERSLMGTQGKVFTISIPNEEMELWAAANQAKAWLIEKPDASIGIVIPDLEHKRQSVARVFQEILRDKVFNIAAPIPLMAYPFIKAALLGLNLVKESIDLETLSVWLRSPFFAGGMSESYRRANFDVFLRSQGELFFSWPKLMALLNTFANGEPFCVPLEKFCALRDSLCLKSKKSSAEWCELIQRLLDCLGWPGERTENSQEFQLKMRWEALLAEYTQLGRILGKHSFFESLFRLQTLSQSLSFLPESLNPKVHILGILEASGLPFDYLWVMGLHREAWPLEPAPNPFIPLSLQKQMELPRSHAKRELKVAKRLTENLSRGAPFVIFSYPKKENEMDHEKSPLLNDFPSMELENLGLKDLMSPWSKIAKIQKQAIRLNQYQAPALLDNEKVGKGALSIQLQATCPFRAFAEIRLNAKPLPKNTLGLAPEIRGEILHQVLMHFWSGLPDKAALCALSEEALNTRLREIIDNTLSHWQIKRPSTLTPVFTALERKRLFQLLSRFVTLEKSRPDFKVIEREKKHPISIAGFQLSIRIDRIDKLETGEFVVLDYKTGLTSVGYWFGERPKDLQLPLYCVTRQVTPGGIAFASLRAEGPKFQGVTLRENMLPGVKTVEAFERWGSQATWNEQCKIWETTIQRLAKDFSQGVAFVDPVNGAHTCRTCSLQSLCRIQSAEVEID